MKFKKLKSQKLISVNISEYKINWDKAPSKGQLQLQQFLRKYWSTHIVLAEMRIPGSLLRADILNCTTLAAIEYHDAVDKGGHHNTYNPFFHKNRAGFFKALTRDLDKIKWYEDNGFTFVEIYKEDLPLLSKEFFKEKV